MKVGLTALLFTLLLGSLAQAEDASPPTPREVVLKALEAQASLPDELPRMPTAALELPGNAPADPNKPGPSKEQTQRQAALHTRLDAENGHLYRALDFTGIDAARAAAAAEAAAHSAAGQQQAASAKAKAHGKPTGNGHGNPGGNP
jgi:hypothetical protein